MARHVLIFIIILVFLSPTLEAASTEIRPALAAFIYGRYADAEDSLKTQLARPGTDRAEVFYLQGRINTWEGDIEAAFDWFEKAVEADPETADYQYWLGMMYGARAQRASIFGKPGKARRARKAFEEAVRLDPDHLDARTKLLEYHLFAPGRTGTCPRCVQAGSEIERKAQGGQKGAGETGVGIEEDDRHTCHSERSEESPVFSVVHYTATR